MRATLETHDPLTKVPGVCLTTYRSGVVGLCRDLEQSRLERNTNQIPVFVTVSGLSLDGIGRWSIAVPVSPCDP